MNTVMIKDLLFSYPENSFKLRCNSFVAKAGEITAIIGPNGEGKSTLLNLLRGRYKYEGHIYINGKSLLSYSELEKMNSIGWVDVKDSNLLIDEIGIKDHLALISFIRNISVPFFYLKSNVKSFLDNINELSSILKKIEPHLDKKIGNLSSGLKQLLSIILGVINGNKQLILCDEITSHLDYMNAELFFSQIKLLSTNQNTAIIIVTHDLPMVSRFADVCYVVSSGIVSQGKLPLYIQNQNTDFNKLISVESNDETK